MTDDARETKRRTRPRVGGLPLFLYVTLLLAIPLAALTFIGAREVNRNVREARAARSVAETVEIQTAATNVLAPLQIERITLAGIARIDELGLGRESVLELVGTDFLDISEENVPDLERDLDALDGALARAPFPEAAELRRQLTQDRNDLDEIRALVDAAGATPSEVVAVFDEFTMLVENVLLDSEKDVKDDDLLAIDARNLSFAKDSANDILRTASREMVQIAETMIGVRNLEPADLLTASAIHEAALGSELGLGDDAAREQLQKEREQLSDYLDAWTASDGPPTPERVQIAPELYQEFAALLTERLEYLASVEAFSRDLSGDIVALSDSVADDAENDVTATFAAILLIALAAVGFQFLVVGSFTRPMRHLRGGAEQIGDGVFDLEPLPLRGPTDVRQVTNAMNEMAGTLSLVDRHVKMLASGDPASDTFGHELPGDVGSSLRESVVRLAVLSEGLQASETRLQQEARRDALTGLPNRFGVLELLDGLLADDSFTPVAVMIVDLDGFKSVNDTNGHEVGDTVLVEIATRMRGCVDEQDIVARIGGDEFLFVIRDCQTAHEALEVGRGVIAEIERAVPVGALRLSLSASAGIKLVTSGSSSLTALKEADAALYHAKDRGRGRVEMYDEALQAAIEHDAEVEFALRRGLREGELRLFLQPAVDLTTGLAYGAEALVRWETGGEMKPPGDFIPIAERSSLIIDIGRWVLRAAAERLVEWERRGSEPTLRLAINVSGRHLMQGNLLTDLDDVFESTGANPALLEIELTESHLLDDVERVSDLLDDVRARGITVSVDDFGTGYSSMTYLQQFPLDSVKIDQRFIAGATERAFEATVVSSVVRLAEAVDLDVIAEGVETAEQLAFVYAQGIRKVQGYLLARPMPVADAEEIIFGGPMVDPATLVPRHQPQ